MTVTLIENTEALAQLCAQVQCSPWIALDTEFTRESTYYAKLGLVQIGTVDVLACVDPLAVDLTPLLDIIYDPARLKVLHAARQDLEVLYDIRRALPQPLFDTQIAAALLGYPDQVGYGALVESVTGVKLPKLHTRTDWEKRPLSPEQLRYAEDDVRYLRDVYHSLAADLERRQRGHWLAQECAALTDPALYRNDPERAYTRIKGGNALTPQAQPRLRALASWRERTAQQRDRPRGWILPDATLIDIARTAPQDAAALAAQALTPRQIESYGADILAALRAAGGEEQIWTEAQPPTPAEQELARAMTARVQAVAQAQAINPTTIATKRSIFALIREDGGPLTQGWRWEVVGKELAALAAAVETRG